MKRCAFVLFLVASSVCWGGVADRPFVWGRIADCGVYEKLNPRFRRAFAFLRRPDLAKLPVGTYVIETNNVWAMVQDCPLGRFGTVQRTEVHHAFIDIQAPIDGPETYGLYDAVADAFEPFDANKDVGLGDRRTKPLTLDPGEFVIFFPRTGAHAPCLTVGEPVRRKKLVIKVRQ